MGEKEWTMSRRLIRTRRRHECPWSLTRIPLMALCLALAAGCQRPDFENSFQPTNDLPDAPTEYSELRFEQLSFPALDSERERGFQGFRRLGFSEFRGVLLRMRPNDPRSSLSRR